MARCNVQGIGNTDPPVARVQGIGVGNTQREACLNAKRDATQALRLAERMPDIVSASVIHGRQRNDLCLRCLAMIPLRAWKPQKKS